MPIREVSAIAVKNELKFKEVLRIQTTSGEKRKKKKKKKKKKTKKKKKK